MLTDEELRRAVFALDLIEQCGQRNELTARLHKVRQAMPCFDDMQNMSLGCSLACREVATEASQIFGEPLDRCRAAAIYVLGASRCKDAVREERVYQFCNRVNRPMLGVGGAMLGLRVSERSGNSRSAGPTTAFHPADSSQIGTRPRGYMMNEELEFASARSTAKAGAKYPSERRVPLQRQHRPKQRVSHVQFLKRLPPWVSVPINLPALTPGNWAAWPRATGKRPGRRQNASLSSAVPRSTMPVHTPRPIIAEALFAGVPAVIGAPFKTCKSLVGIDAAISIGTGRPWLRSFTVPTPLSVVYFSGKGGPCVARKNTAGESRHPRGSVWPT